MARLPRDGAGRAFFAGLLAAFTGFRAAAFGAGLRLTLAFDLPAAAG